MLPIRTRFLHAAYRHGWALESTFSLKNPHLSAKSLSFTQLSLNQKEFRHHSTACTSNLNHYQEVSKGYHSVFFYTRDGQYERWQFGAIAKNLLNISANARIVDIGGGTGRFASFLHSRYALTDPVLCVDMSPDMLKLAEDEPGVATHCSDAVSFATKMQPESVDYAFNKELIHHLQAPVELSKFYSGLYAGLKTGGQSITITRPKKNISYPFFTAAKQVWMENAHSSDEIQSVMRTCGFKNVRLAVEEIPLALPSTEWKDMIRSRMWSTFSQFSDEDLNHGIREIERRFESQNETVHFTERLYIIIGEKQ